MRLKVMLRATAPIFFNVDQAKKQLLEKGVVYTIRRKRKSEGDTMARQGNLFKFVELGKVHVEYVEPVDMGSCEDDVDEYVGESGFPDAKSWCGRAAIGSNALYKVTLLR